MSQVRRGTLSGAWVVPQPVFAGLLLLAAAAVLLSETVATADQPVRAVIWGGIAFATYAFGLLCLVGSKGATALGLSRWRFGSWSLLWCGLSFGLATLTWNQAQNGASAQIAISSVLAALFLVAVGIAFWVTGYFVGPSELVRACAVRGLLALERRVTKEVRTPAAPWIIYSVGLAARLVSTATTGRLGYVGDVSSAVTTATWYGQILSGFSLFAPLGVAAAALQVFRERSRAAKLTLAVLFPMELAFGAAAGGKQSFVITVLAVVIPFSASRYRLPKTVLAGIVLVFLVIVIPFNQAYRSAARGSASLTPSEAVAAAPGILRDTITENGPLSVLPASLAYLLQRSREIDNPALIIQRTPSQIAYRSPFELVEAPFLGIVPRALWPGKPIMATGYLFNQEYYGRSASIYSSSAITPVGDLYRHGGWTPTIVGMFLLGCSFRLLDDVLDVRENPHSVFLVLLLLPNLVKGEQDWVTLLAGIPSTLLVWLFAVYATFEIRRTA